MRLALVLVAIAACILPLSTAAVPPATCDGSCTIAGSTMGFVSPVTVVSSGSSVSWSSSDIGHANADGTSNGDEHCFSVAYNPTTPSTPIRFDVVGGELHATKNAVTYSCTTAHALPDGSFALTYFCLLHANMRGALVVRA